jgi:hypothetical protein
MGEVLQKWFGAVQRFASTGKPESPIALQGSNPIDTGMFSQSVQFAVLERKTLVSRVVILRIYEILDRFFSKMAILFIFAKR